MTRKLLATGALSAAALLMLVLLPSGTAESDELTEVVVTNFPHPQDIEGTVRIEGPIESAALARTTGIVVPPVERADSTRLIDAGVLVTEGYPYVVLSIAGQTKGEVLRSGEVGAILIPVEETVALAFRETGRLMFPLETTGAVERGAAYFDSTPRRFELGFPNYRVLLYNTSDRTVDVDLFAYLTN